MRFDEWWESPAREETERDVLRVSELLGLNKRQTEIVYDATVIGIGMPTTRYGLLPPDEQEGVA